jgi:transposase
MGRRELVVSDEDRAALESLAGSARRAEADRARAILRSAAGETSESIAPTVGVLPCHVRYWRMRYRRDGIEALREKPRPGRAGVKAAAALPVVMAILSEAPPAGVVWTVPRLREEVARRAGPKISASWLRVVMVEKGGCAGVGRGTRSRGGKMWLPSTKVVCG